MQPIELQGRQEQMKKEKPSQHEKIVMLCEHLKQIMDHEFTGMIRANFNQGNICKVEKHEEILRKNSIRKYMLRCRRGQR